MRVGVLTGGGDCPGLNAVIRAVVRRGVQTYDYEFVGYQSGWRGLIDGKSEPLTVESTRGLLHRGGTILGTSRTNPFAIDGGAQRVVDQLANDGVDAIVAIGGEDTLGVAARLGASGMSIVGVPKTIDNDLAGTDYTFGFHTAVQTATDAIDRLHTTAESHDRVMVVEVMGRHAGWIATYAGLAGGADVTLVPEEPFDVDRVCERIERRHQRGAHFSIVVVAEGARPVDAAIEQVSEQRDEFGHVRLGGIGNRLAAWIEDRTGYETRVTILGHVLRGGTPTAFDRVIASRFGVEAVDAIAEGTFGVMVALRGTDVVRTPLGSAVETLKTIDDGLFETARVFFG